MARKPDVDPTALQRLLSEVFGARTPLTWERTEEGVSTQVYRVRRGRETFYLRVAEEADEDLRTDAELHRRLRELGVAVAQVVHAVAFDDDLGRSVMVTTEVPGRPLAEWGSARTAAQALHRAGQDLALVNQVPVDGFGFVRREGVRWPVRAQFATHAEFVTSHLPDPWPGPLADLFQAPVLQRLEELVHQELAVPPARAVLAHGDFDTTQIFVTDGSSGGDPSGVGSSRAVYSGLIDFGEVRGAEVLFDLGHFHLHDGEALPVPLLPALVRGYQEVQPLPADYEQGITRSAVLLGLRQLCRWLGPARGLPLDHPVVAHRTARLQQLITTTS